MTKPGAGTQGKGSSDKRNTPRAAPGASETASGKATTDVLDEDMWPAHQRWL